MFYFILYFVSLRSISFRLNSFCFVSLPFDFVSHFTGTRNSYLTEAIRLDLTCIGLTLLMLRWDVWTIQKFHFHVSNWKKKTYKIYNVYQDSSLIKKLVEYDIQVQPEASMSLYRPTDYSFSLCSIHSTYYLKTLINEIKV
jgi:hypothetical protein